MSVSMAGSSQLYKKSTFPPLLDSYLPLNCQNQNRANWQKTEKNKKEQIRNNSRILSEEEKDELLKQALLEKHHLETYKNLYKIRNILYERYKALLNEKVLKQRIQIKAFDLKQQLKHKEQKCTLRRKLPFCKLSHDTKYMESLSQSNSYWITGLQNELTKLGIIKNQQDYENFWKVAWKDVPGSKIKKLPDIKARMSAAKSLLFSTPTGIKPLQQVKSFPNSRLKKPFPAYFSAELLRLEIQNNPVHLLAPSLQHNWILYQNRSESEERVTVCFQEYPVNIYS